jgi:guanidinopropionase
MVENVYNPMNEPRYCGIPTFMRTSLATNLNSLDIALVGVPYDGAVEARSGVRQGPRQIRDMSSMMRTIHHVTRISPYKLCRIADFVYRTECFNSTTHFFIKIYSNF